MRNPEDIEIEITFADGEVVTAKSHLPSRVLADAVLAIEKTYPTADDLTIAEINLNIAETLFGFLSQPGVDAEETFNVNDRDNQYTITITREDDRS